MDPTHTTESNLQRQQPMECASSTTSPFTRDPVASFRPIGTTKIKPMIVTPPTSPAEIRCCSDELARESTSHSTSAFGQPGDGRTLVDNSQSVSISSSCEVAFQVCPFDVKILSDRHGANEIFGSGAWSTVYKAIQQPAPFSVGLVTPPSSPVAANPFLLAVKVPMRKDAEPILEHEGEILTYLSSFGDADKFVVPFFGVIPKFSSLVLAAIPLSLDEHIQSCARKAKEALTTWNMSEPVIGTQRIWLNLAKKIIAALHWLHDEAGVVHGDIKPGNFLLKPATTSNDNGQFPFQPIFIDFSSGYLVDSKKSTPNTLSAVTREYTAPELLSSAVLRDPKSSTTFASDVFSTAVTLLVAATGDPKVYSGSVFQRQAMASQGWQVLQLVRGGDQGSRIPRCGMVERTLERAVLRAGMGRISAGQWLDVVEEMMIGEPSKAP